MIYPRIIIKNDITIGLSGDFKHSFKTGSSEYFLSGIDIECFYRYGSLSPICRITEERPLIINCDGGLMGFKIDLRMNNKSYGHIYYG